MRRLRSNATGLAARLGMVRALLEAALLRSPLAFVAAFFVVYGYRYEDLSDFGQLADDPFATLPDATRQFLHSSPLPFFLGWPLGHWLGVHAAYWIVCLLGFVILVAGVTVYLRPFAAADRRTILYVAFSCPILLVLFRWLGKGDPYLLGLFLFVRACRDRPVARTLFSMLLVLVHKELGTLMLLGDALLRWTLRRSIVIGAVAGNILVTLYLRRLEPAPFSRVDLALSYMNQGLVGWAHNPLAHVLLSLTWFWLFLYRRRHASDAPRIGLYVLCCFAICFDGADYTRDFLLCAFPLVVYTAERMTEEPDHARLALSRPVPLLFLLQMQLESFDQVRDVWWLARLEAILQRFWA